MNCPRRSLSWFIMNRLKEMLLSSSQKKVAAGINATRDSRIATTSYLRASCFNNDPSPNHELAVKVAKVTDLPCSERLPALINPSTTPTQTLDGSPLWHAKLPD